MANNEILEKVQDILREVIDNDDLVITSDNSAEDIEGYDSLAHIQVIDAVQKKFKIRFKAAEMISWDNFGALVKCIESKL